MASSFEILSRTLTSPRTSPTNSAAKGDKLRGGVDGLSSWADSEDTETCEGTGEGVRSGRWLGEAGGQGEDEGLGE